MNTSRVGSVPPNRVPFGLGLITELRYSESKRQFCINLMDIGIDDISMITDKINTKKKERKNPKINIIIFGESQRHWSKTLFVLSDLVLSLVINSASNTQSCKRPHHGTQNTAVNSYSRN